MPWFLRLVLLLALTSRRLSRPGSYSADAQTAASTAAVSSPRPAHSPPLGPLDAAFTLYRRGDFDGAIHDYHQILQQNPASPEAYAGLTRVYLKKRDIAQASATVHQALQAADGPEVHVALGEVYFRQGKISDAELEWAKVINAGHSDARAYLGLARVRWAISNYKSAWAPA